VAEQSLFVVGVNTAGALSRASRGRSRTSATITRSGAITPAARTSSRPFRPRPAPASPASARIGAGGFGSEALAPVLLTAAGQLGYIQGRRYAQAKKRRRRLASSRSTARAKPRVTARVTVRGQHGRTARRTARLGSQDSRAAAKVIRQLFPGLGARGAQRASNSVIRELKVKGKRLALPGITPIPSRKAELKRAQAQLAKADRAAAAAAKAAAHARAQAAAAAAKAEKAQERALASNARDVQRAHDRAQKTLEQADAKAAKAADKAVKAVEKARAADAKAAAKAAKPKDLVEQLTEFVRGRLHLPNASTAISVATGLPMPGVNPDAVAQQEECRQADDKRRNRVAKQARCAGVPCAQEVPQDLPENVVAFPKPKG